MADQSVEKIATELYAVDPARFVAARTEAVQRARAAGDGELATAVGRLRRPSMTAWAVNLLVRSAGAQMSELVRLGEELRVAQRQLQATRLRELSRRRRELLGALSHRARQLATDAGHPLGGMVLTEVEQTLAAALVDSKSAQTVCSGRLTRPLQHIGLGTEPMVPSPPPVPEGDERERYSPPMSLSPPVSPLRSVSPSPATLPSPGTPLSAAVSPSEPVPPSPPEGEMVDQRRQQEQRLARELARANQELENAVARAERAEQELLRTAERYAQLDRRLAKVQQERDGAAREYAEARHQAQSAAHARVAAERRVRQLTEEHKAR